jgi:uncharacterized RDD family membrane protein YckC
MFCPACGQETLEPTNFCQFCGHSLTPSPGFAETEASLPAIVHFAGFWRRFVAIFLDGILIFFVVSGAQAVIALMMGAKPALYSAFPRGGKLGAVTMLGFVIGAVIKWLYWALMESSVQQATLGKMAIGIKVTDLHGEPISFGRATGRYFGKIISVLLLFIGFMMAGWTEKKQALHDIMAGTLVVKK